MGPIQYSIDNFSTWIVEHDNILFRDRRLNDMIVEHILFPAMIITMIHFNVNTYILLFSHIHSSVLMIFSTNFIQDAYYPIHL